MWFDPSQPMHDRYQVDARLPHAGARRRGRHDLAARQRVLPLGVQLVRDDRARTASRTRSTTRTRRRTSRSRRCTTTSRGRSRRSSAGARSARSTRREMRINQNSRDYFEIGDRDDLAYEEKLAATASSPTTTSRSTPTENSATAHLAHLDEATRRVRREPEFDDLLVQTVRATFPAHEHEHFVAHYRGLLGMWVDRPARGSARIASVSWTSSSPTSSA